MGMSDLTLDGTFGDEEVFINAKAVSFIEEHATDKG